MNNAQNKTQQVIHCCAKTVLREKNCHADKVTNPTLMPSSMSVGATWSLRSTTNLANCLTLMMYLGSSVSALMIFVQRATCNGCSPAHSSSSSRLLLVYCCLMPNSRHTLLDKERKWGSALKWVIAISNLIYYYYQY